MVTYDRKSIFKVYLSKKNRNVIIDHYMTSEEIAFDSKINKQINK